MILGWEDIFTITPKPENYKQKRNRFDYEETINKITIKTIKRGLLGKLLKRERLSPLPFLLLLS